MAPGGSASRSSCGSSGGPDSEPPSDPGGQLEAAGGCLYRLSARHRLEGGAAADEIHDDESPEEEALLRVDGSGGREGDSIASSLWKAARSASTSSLWAVSYTHLRAHETV